MALLSVASGISCLYILLRVAPQIHANYCNLLEINCFCKILYFPVYVVLPIFSLLWDAIDALIDVYTFEQLERGKIIDSVIYRNVYVNNAILVFTILGVLKMFLIMWLFLRSHKFFSNKQERGFSKYQNIHYSFNISSRGCHSVVPGVFLPLKIFY